MWSIFTSIQIFKSHSLLVSFHDPSNNFARSILYYSGNLLNTFGLVPILWLAATLARINKRKRTLKKWKNQAKLNTIAEDANKYNSCMTSERLMHVQFTSCVYRAALCQPFFPNKPHTQTFLTLQSELAADEELCLNNNSALRGRFIWIIVI